MKYAEEILTELRKEAKPKVSLNSGVIMEKTITN